MTEGQVSQEEAEARSKIGRRIVYWALGAVTHPWRGGGAGPQGGEEARRSSQRRHGHVAANDRSVGGNGAGITNVIALGKARA